MDWGQLLQLAFPVSLLLVGYVAGCWLERRHLASIRAREQALDDVVVLTLRHVPEGVRPSHARLVTGSVVVSSDYFKTFVAGLRKLLGGRFRGYETLLERARREALLRLKEQARAADCDLVLGVRYATTTITGSITPSIEVIAYGTALRR